MKRAFTQAESSKNAHFIEETAISREETRSAPTPQSYSNPIAPLISKMLNYTFSTQFYDKNYCYLIIFITFAPFYAH